MSAPMQINRPEVLAEVAGLVADYERALVANDVTALEGFFWDSALALRFGVTEELYGAEEITQFRRARVVNFGGRQTVRQSLLTLGTDLAVATLEFSIAIYGSARHGRQSQVWARLPTGWRIISAHVSHRVTPENGAAFSGSTGPAYAAAAAALLGLPVAAEYRDEVAMNIDIMAKIVQPLLALDLPACEPAPVFVP